VRGDRTTSVGIVREGRETAMKEEGGGRTDVYHGRGHSFLP
jgi:hypothetical protein